MYFEIELSDKQTPPEILGFCFLKICDLWPNAIGLTRQGVVYYKNALRSFPESKRLLVLKECADPDRLLAARFFKRGPLIQITYMRDPRRLILDAAQGAEEAARAISNLPCWGRHVSRRFEAVHG